METSPAFFEGKSECRVRVFLESGFCTGPSPGPSPSPVRVSQYALSNTPFVYTVPGPHGHDIKLNSFKTSVALKFKIIFKNLTTTNRRKSAKS